MSRCFPSQSPENEVINLERMLILVWGLFLRMRLSLCNRVTATITIMQVHRIIIDQMIQMTMNKHGSQTTCAMVFMFVKEVYIC